MYVLFLLKIGGMSVYIVMSEIKPIIYLTVYLEFSGKSFLNSTNTHRVSLLIFRNNCSIKGKVIAMIEVFL